MIPYTQFKQEEEERFDKNFLDLVRLPENGQSIWLDKSYIDDIKSFLASHDQRLLALVGEVVREMKQERVSDRFENFGEMNIEIATHNQALSDLQSKLSALIEEEK